MDAVDYMEMSGRDVRLSYNLAKLSAAFDGRYYPFFYDPFGFLDGRRLFPFPKRTEKGLLEACLERARELSGCTLMFSGGVDSTFLLACFRHAGADVRLVNYCPGGARICPELKRLVDEEFDISYVAERQGVARFRHVYMGSLADTLFFSTARLKEEKSCRRIMEDDGSVGFVHEFSDTPFVPLQDRMLHKFRYDDIELVLSYAALLDVPLDDNRRIARFIDWITCLPKHLCQASWGYFVGMDSFFASPVFLDIAYSRYWDANQARGHGKEEFRDFIGDVFGTDFGVRKNYT